MSRAESAEGIYLEAYWEAIRPPEWHVTEKDIKALKERLRVNVPTEYPVRYRRVILRGGEMGDCSLVCPKHNKQEPYFLIRVDKRLPLVAQFLIIAHEYAHARQWRGETLESHRVDDHDGEFGLAYALAWSKIGG